jgi:hypothetical protein
LGAHGLAAEVGARGGEGGGTLPPKRSTILPEKGVQSAAAIVPTMNIVLT